MSSSGTVRHDSSGTRAASADFGRALPRVEMPPAAIGVASLVLGVISLGLFFFPILGAPIAALGIVGGVIGALAAAVGSRSAANDANSPRSQEESAGLRWFDDLTALRWSVGAIAIAGMALTVNLSIAYAPEGYLPPPIAPVRPAVSANHAEPLPPPPARAARR